MHTGHTRISFTSRKSIKVWGLETGANLSGARYFCYFFVKNIRTNNFRCSSRSGHSSLRGGHEKLELCHREQKKL